MRRPPGTADDAMGHHLADHLDRVLRTTARGARGEAAAATRTHVDGHTKGAEMRQPSATDHAEWTVASFRQPSRPTSLEAPEPGERFPRPRPADLDPPGDHGLRRPDRAHEADTVGDSGIIVDVLAIATVIPVPIAAPSPDTSPATLGDSGPRCRRNETADDALRTPASPAGTAQRRWRGPARAPQGAGMTRPRSRHHNAAGERISHGALGARSKERT